jgi:exonuclease SbcD
MLKVFHTADWHLGQSFCGFDRDYEHAQFLGWLLEQLQSQQPDALLLAGDVFDSINPSAMAQKRFYSFLAQAHALLPKLQIVITAGNHDAAARLEAPSSPLEALEIAIVGTVQRDADGAIDVKRFLVPLMANNGDVEGIALAVPFLRPSDVPFVPDAADPYLDGIRELYRRITEEAFVMQAEQFPNAALIAMGHCHLHGGAESPESERRLIVGGAEAVGIDVFDARIVYVALGHLHRTQKFDAGRVRYSGSPIPLSFAETEYRHQLLQLTLDNRTLSAVDEVLIPRSTTLLKVPATGALPIDELLLQLEALDLDLSLPPDQQPFLEVRVQETGPDPTRRTRIEQALEKQPVRLASIKVERQAHESADSQSDKPLNTDSLKDIQPLDIFMDAWREKYSNNPDAAIVEAFREILLQESHS